MFAEGQLAGGATYTPASEGLYFEAAATGYSWNWEYFNATPGWLYRAGSGESWDSGAAPSDGTNMRLHHIGGIARDYQLMRQHYSGNTYATFGADVPAGAALTPGAGIFFWSAETTTCRPEEDFPNLGWSRIYDMDTTSVSPHSTIITDGVEIRLWNNGGALAWIIGIRVYIA